MSLFHHKKKHSKEHSSSFDPSQIIDNSSLYNNDSSVGPPLPVKHWVDGQLMLCVNARSADYVRTGYDKQIAIPMNTVFPFESKLFRGRAIVRSIDLPSTNKAYFKGRARKMDLTLQGQFKRRLCFDRLYTGQIFDAPFVNLPGHLLISGAIKVVRSLAPAVVANIDSTTPHMISPLASAAQVIEVSKPGEERPLPEEPQECLDLMGHRFVGMKFTERKSFFNDLGHLSQYHFEPEWVYTISCYTHMIAPSSYSVHILGMKWGIQQYITSPFQAMQVVLPKRGHDDADDSSSHSNDTTDHNQGDDDKQIEIMDSEALECESKEEENEHSRSSSRRSDRNNSDFGDLNNCEFLLDLQVWHSKLVDELYPKHKKKGHPKHGSSGGLRSLFGV